MIHFFIDFLMISVLVIGITAVNGVLTNGIGNKLFGRKTKSEFIDQSTKIQSGWKQVGGNK